MGATYDQETQSLSQRVLLGSTLGTVNPEDPTRDSTDPCGIDGHNSPAIVMDSEGILHVVLGGHGRPFKYTASKRPHDSSEWTEPYEFGDHNRSHTYIGFVIDAADALHLASRSVNDSSQYSLNYMRKKKGEDWVALGELVIPHPHHYSRWNQKLTVDRNGTLFLTHFYYSHRLTPEEFEAYTARWPKEEYKPGKAVTVDNTNPHDPVLLTSFDGGDTWKVATTVDLTTPWLRLASADPNLSDEDGWNDVTNYDTIRTAVAGNRLHVLARANKGVNTWRFNRDVNAWSRRGKNVPEWSDERGWGEAKYYSTIRVAEAPGGFYLVARGASGMDTWSFNAETAEWSHLSRGAPEWSDEKGWGEPKYYETIRAAVLNNDLYLMARGSSGVNTWRRSAGSTEWSKVAMRVPEWSDERGWGEVQYYDTIRAAVVNNEIYLMARGASGVDTWRLSTENAVWSRVDKGLPEWSDERGWGEAKYYRTIRTAVVQNVLFLMARGSSGMDLWKLDSGSGQWSRLVRGEPEWSDDRGWGEPQYYETIRAAVLGNDIFLMARGATGIVTWKFDTQHNAWEHLSGSIPAWSDVAGWHDVTNYATIRTAVLNDEIYLTGRANSGISTWVRRSAFTP